MTVPFSLEYISNITHYINRDLIWNKNCNTNNLISFLIKSNISIYIVYWYRFLLVKTDKQ